MTKPGDVAFPAPAPAPPRGVSWTRRIFDLMLIAIFLMPSLRAHLYLVAGFACEVRNEVWWTLQESDPEAAIHVFESLVTLEDQATRSSGSGYFDVVYHRRPFSNGSRGYDALYRLGKLRRGHPSATRVLNRLVFRVRGHRAFRITCVNIGGCPDPSVLAFLLETVRDDPDPSRRLGAFNALGRYQPDDISLRAIHTMAATDTDPWRRERASVVLRQWAHAGHIAGSEDSTPTASEPAPRLPMEDKLENDSEPGKPTGDGSRHELRVL